MSNKIITTVVITLGILIVLSFIALFYGLYLKISKNSVNISYSPDLISLNLKNDEEIVNFEAIDQNRLLITIKKGSSLKGAIYIIDKSKIKEFIEK